MKYISSKKASEILGLHPNTLRKYADEGKIEHIKTSSGQRRYNVDSFLCDSKSETIICYCRVSSYSQKPELDNQVKWMREQYPRAEIIKDIGSALNYKRKGLKSILGRCVSGEKLIVVVAYRDRLARFGFELIEWIINEYGGKVVVLNNNIREPEQELTEDLLTIIHVFSCRLYGIRNYKNKKNKDATNKIAEDAARYVVEELSLHIQRDDMDA